MKKFSMQICGDPNALPIIRKSIIQEEFNEEEYDNEDSASYHR
jgi:hypothetical protein